MAADNARAAEIGAAAAALRQVAVRLVVAHPAAASVRAAAMLAVAAGSPMIWMMISRFELGGSKVPPKSKKGTVRPEPFGLRLSSRAQDKLRQKAEVEGLVRAKPRTF